MNTARPSFSGWRGRLATLTLTVLLYFFHLQRTRAENRVDYRYQIYREDNGRIAVDTHSALFAVSLKPKILVNGELVIDTISGATPTGMPAYKDFALLSPGQYGLNTVQATYGNQMASVGYANNPQGFIDYVNANFPGFAPLVNATYNQATNSYSQALAANPNYRSAKVPTIESKDFRRSISLGVPITFGKNTVTPQLSYSEESDYTSTGVAMSYAREFNDKNTTLTMGWAHNFDNVKYTDINAVTAWLNKNTDDFFIGLNQLINPKAYVTLNVTYGHSEGMLNDQYRQIYAANAFVSTDITAAGFPAYTGDGLAQTNVYRPEQRPSTKDKFIVYASYTQFITKLQGSLDTAYRFYHDSYGVNGHTIETAWHQKIGRKVMLSPSFRYYRQNQADFYHYMFPNYQYWDPANPQYKNFQYYSSDYRLSEFESFSYGVSLTWRVTKMLSFDATYSRYNMQGLDGTTPQDMYPTANVFGIGLRLWF